MLDYSGAPPECWFLALEYVVFIMNRIALDSLGGRTPIKVLEGVTPDISMIPQFRFYDPVYVAHFMGKGYPSKSTEIMARFVGFSQNVGHSLTFKVLTEDTKKILHCSRLRLAADPSKVNRRLLKEREEPDATKPGYEEVVDYSSKPL